MKKSVRISVGLMILCLLVSLFFFSRHFYKDSLLNQEQSPTADSAQTTEGLTVRQLAVKYDGDDNFESDSWNNQILFKFQEPDATPVGFVKVVINGVPETIVNDEEVVPVFWVYRDASGVLRVSQKYSFFQNTDNIRLFHPDNQEYYFIPIARGNGFDMGVVLIPVEIMPKVINDLSSWDKTEATLYSWDSASSVFVFSNLNTGEIYVSYTPIYVVTDAHTPIWIEYDNLMWGFVSAAQGRVYMTQSKPDYEKLEMALAYYKDVHGDETGINDPYTACWVMHYPAGDPDSYDYDKDLVSEYCGVFYFEY